MGVAPDWPESELGDGGGETTGLALAAARCHDCDPNVPSTKERAMPESDELKFGKVQVRQSDADDFEVGAEADGHWVSFARIPGEQVRANVANLKAQAAAAETETT